MSAQISQNFVVTRGAHLHLQNSARERRAGRIGKLDCKKNAIDIFEMMGVWYTKYPLDKDTCGGDVGRNTMYDMIAAGCEDGSAIMIDDWTYMTKIDFP
ncbi:hypothetical protein Trydic_g13874 [Trypoxylus dichotomus]